MRIRVIVVRGLPIARALDTFLQRYQLIRTTLSSLAAPMAPLDLTMNVSHKSASVVEGRVMHSPSNTTLEPFTFATHGSMLETWLDQRHVARWFGEPSPHVAFAKSPPFGGDQAVIAVAGRPIGYLRWHRVDASIHERLRNNRYGEAA